jgi:hypothetical protein
MGPRCAADAEGSSGSTLSVHRGAANGRNRRYPAVGARVETGPESTCSTRLCRTRRVAGEALPAVDQTMRHNPALGIMAFMPISA